VAQTRGDLLHTIINSRVFYNVRNCFDSEPWRFNQMTTTRKEILKGLLSFRWLRNIGALCTNISSTVICVIPPISPRGKLSYYFRNSFTIFISDLY
jgi:hypothetical protein